MADRGYLAVRLEDIGAAAGVSGPAIYRHFAGKEALLVELLVGISTRLLAGAQAVLDDAPDAAAALDGLIEFPPRLRPERVDLIRIQDRDLPNLPPAYNGQVRRAPASLRRDLGGSAAHLDRLAGRSRRPGDGARRLRTAQLDTAHQAAEAWGRSRSAARAMTAAALGRG